MSPTLDDDLGRWEAGTLSADEVAARHPNVDLRPLTLLHAQLTELAASPAPDLDAAWARVAAGLTDRRPRWARVRRALAAGIALGVVAVPTVSYAASTDPVRDVLRDIGDFMGGHQGGSTEPAEPAFTSADDADLARTAVGSHTTEPPLATEPEPVVSTAPPATGSDPVAATVQGDDDEESSDGPAIDDEQGSEGSDDTADGQEGDSDDSRNSQGDDDDSNGDGPAAESGGDRGSDRPGQQVSNGNEGSEEG